MSVPLRSLASTRSYFFRELVARYDREQREYGGRALEDLDLEAFRAMRRLANLKALDQRRRANTRWNDQTKAWEQLQ